MKEHELKCWPRYFRAILDGSKTFEVRKDDRNFLTGDTLNLREWDPETKEYTGRELTRKISYLMAGGYFGVKTGYVVLALEKILP